MGSLHTYCRSIIRAIDTKNDFRKEHRKRDLSKIETNEAFYKKQVK